MLSNRFFPFERNRYFYGKLLTAADLEAEQRYINNKRRLINRLLFGIGVVRGMNVIKVDDNSVVIESGFALDSEGREIVIPQSVVKKLSIIKGFEALERNKEESIKTAYLCVGYQEEMVEPIHSVAKSALSDENDGSEYNKIQETALLFLTDLEPEGDTDNLDAENRILLWNEDGIRITFIAPKYVKTDGKFNVETEIEKGASKRSISLKYNLELAFITYNGGHTAPFTFEEPILGEGDRYNLQLLLEAFPNAPQKGQIQIKDFSLKIGDTIKNVKETFTLDINIRDNPEAGLLNELKQRPLLESFDPGKNIYLCRFHLIMSSDYYIIDKIDTLPFGQVVLTGAEYQSIHSFEPILPPQSLQPTVEVNTTPPPLTQEIRSGIAKVCIPHSNSKNKYYYSDEIPHQLGLGSVFITAGLSDDNVILFGNPLPFSDSLTWGVSLYKKKGVFKIGVCLLKPIPAEELTFSWMAVRQSEPLTTDNPLLTLHPNIVYISSYETARFEIGGENKKFSKGELIWTVDPPDGGCISRNGEFTAFGKPGFYKITAESILDSTISATAFVVIS